MTAEGSTSGRSPAELLAVIADALPAALAYVDAGERYRYVNRHYTKLFANFGGRVGITVREALGAESYERVRPYIARALAGESVAFENELRQADGDALWLSVTYVPDIGLDGGVRGYAALLEDVTDRRNAERSLERTLAELRSAHHTLDAVVRASPAAIMLLDRDGTVRMWNPAAERIYGLSAAEAIGRRMPVIAPGQEAEFEDNLARVTGGEVDEAVEARRMRRGGSMFDAVIWRAPVRGADGSTQLLSVVADVTARRRLEDGLRVLAESSRVLAESLDYRETLERAARLAVPRYGDWCFVDLLVEDGVHFDRVAGASRDPDRADLVRAFLRRYPLAPELDRGVAHVVASATPVLMKTVDGAYLRAVARDDQHRANLEALGARSFACAPLVVRGRAIGALTVVSRARALDEHDLRVIEELARQAAAAIDNARLFAAERQARERISRLQEVTAALSRAETADDVVEVTCRIGSQAMEAVSGVIWLADGAGGLVMAGSWDTPPEFVEQFRVLAPGDERFPAIDVARTGAPVYVETADDWERLAPGVYPLVLARGRLASLAALPMASEARVAGVIAFGHPLGHRYDSADRAFYATLAHHCHQALERARLLDEARAASAAAFRASRAKDEFLAMLGHELRNPLAPIVTALDLLRHRGTPGFERERQVIERQVHHLCRLVDDLLDVARITAGRIQLERELVQLHEVVARSVEMVRPLIDERRHALAVEAEVAVGLVIDGDGTRLAQVVTNLLVNAAKYTPAGGRISVLVAREGRDAVLRVRDTGAGISTELLPRVFDLFEQGPQALHRPYGGLGLGLAIVKSLVTLHGGTVSAHSDGPGRGSEFVVRLPIARSDPEPATSRSRSS